MLRQIEQQQQQQKLLAITSLIRIWIYNPYLFCIVATEEVSFSVNMKVSYKT